MGSLAAGRTTAAGATRPAPTESQVLHQFQRAAASRSAIVGVARPLPRQALHAVRSLFSVLPDALPADTRRSNTAGSMRSLRRQTAQVRVFGNHLRPLRASERQ